MEFKYPLNELIYDLPEKDYFKSGAVTRSYLKKMAVSPAEAHLPEEDSGSMGLGKACHILHLEGQDKFDDLVIEAPTKTKGVKWEQLAQAESDKCIVSIDGRQLAMETVDAMMLHPQVNEIFAAPDVSTEVTIFWLDEETGLICGARLDFIIPSLSIIGDLKFVQKGAANERKFRYMIRDYGYDLQAPWYTEAVAKATGQVYEHFLFVVTETDKPHMVGVFEMDRDWMGDMHWQNHSLLRLEADCRKAGHWPNYDPNNPGIQTLVPYY